MEQDRRTLALCDIENLMGTSPRSITASQMEATVEEFSSKAELASNDLLVVAVNPALAFDVHRAAPHAGLRCRSGPDGADLALLELVHDPFWVAQRFGRVVIGSGDGIFTEAVVALNHTEAATVVIGRAGRTSRRLRLAAQEVVLLADPGRPVLDPRTNHTFSEVGAAHG